MRHFSKKRAKIERELIKVKAEIAQEREHVCTGCETGFKLTHSHLIPKSKRTDLIAVKENITYHCMGFNFEKGCHYIWEHGTLLEKKELNDFDVIMAYIKETDTEFYNQILNK